MENNKTTEIKPYIAPDFEIVEIDFEQNILGGSEDTPDMGGRDWM